MHNVNGVSCAKSIIVECGMKMPDCAPKDEWRSVAYLDNSGSSLPTKFTYYYFIGTQWSTEMKNSFNIEHSVTAKVEASFYKIFSASASHTLTTGYNWAKTSTEAKNKETSYTIESEVPGRAVIKIEQAQGTCGDSNVFTEMFRHTDPISGKSHIFQA